MVLNSIPVSRPNTTIKINMLLHGIMLYLMKHNGYSLHMNYQRILIRQKKTIAPISQLMVPVPVKSVLDSSNLGSNVGAELTGKLNKEDVMKWLAKFYQRREIKAAVVENGIDNYIYHQTYLSFRKFCLNDKLPVDLHVTFSDIIAEACHLDSLLPYFIQHAKQAFPHLECIDDLKKISDLRLPANWYPEARALTRKIVFHSGPTNSGKTFHALERFFNSKSGVYCGPLKLLASEVYYKSNQCGVPCDLVTGEERNFASVNSKSPSSHVSCTVEMVSVNTPYEVAVIDEIQMLKDPSRGWAWTRALLGVVAEEVHVCGEAAAIDVVKEILMSASEEIEMRRYKRLTELIIEDASLGSLDKIRPGDCLVCFNKQDIFWSMRQIEAMGIECAVIYGSLPPGTKLAQAKKFNDPDHPCKVLVATDAIGMGLNLNIGRVIFNSLIKPTTNEKGEKEMDTISTSQALQIAGRAGRYGTQFSIGYVTTLKSEDLPTLKRLLSQHPEPINQVGLHPTAEQIELYAYHLPHANLSNLIDIFVNLSTLDDSLYFICNINDFKFLADMIQHVPLPLRARYVFCCAPINKKIPFVCSMFLKFARQYSRNEVLSFDWLGRQIGLPFSCPNTLLELVHLESVFDVLDLYLWLSYRFQDLFPDACLVRDMQKELDCLIQTGVAQLTRLLINSETGVSSGTSKAVEAEENRHVPNLKKTPYFHSHDAITIVNPITSHGRIADRLLSEGLLTPKLLKDLKKEWQCEKDNEAAQASVSTITNPIIIKRSKNHKFKVVKRINRIR